MKAQFINELEFNFDDSPYKQYVSKRGIRGPQVPNPNKRGYGQGLTPEEQNIIQKHEENLGKVREAVDELDQQVNMLKDELYDLEMGGGFEETELEQFYSDIQNRFGFNALDILNSGASDEDKIKRLDALDPSNDIGKKSFEELIHNYNYYHPDDPDSSTIEDLKFDIKKIETQMKERQNTVNKLEDKIYNIKNY